MKKELHIILSPKGYGKTYYEINNKLKEKDKEIEKLNNKINKLSIELSVEKDKLLDLSNLISKYDKELKHKTEQYEYLRHYYCLANMKQYPIERDVFSKIFYNIDIDYYDFLWNTTTDNFKLWHYDDTFYILHLPSGTLITWYKHLGRCLECNKELSIEDYQWLAKELEIELKDLKEGK